MTEPTELVARLRSSELAVREAIARVIDPHANWDDGTKDDEQFSHQRAKALEKALPIAGLIEAQAAEIAALREANDCLWEEVASAVRVARKHGATAWADANWGIDDTRLKEAQAQARAALAQHQEPTR